nr:MAG TPA: hypothetical protein [Caudoviricetes sp.]
MHESSCILIIQNTILTAVRCRLTREIQKRFKTIEKAGIR